MKEKKNFVEKAEGIRKQVSEYKIHSMYDYMSEHDRLFNPNPELHDFVVSFQHLVYAFDNHLPLNTEISKLSSLKFCSDNVSAIEKEKDEVLKYIDFFISYLKEYSV